MCCCMCCIICTLVHLLGDLGTSQVTQVDEYCCLHVPLQPHAWYLKLIVRLAAVAVHNAHVSAIVAPWRRWMLPSLASRIWLRVPMRTSRRTPCCSSCCEGLGKTGSCTSLSLCTCVLVNSLFMCELMHSRCVCNLEILVLRSCATSGLKDNARAKSVSMMIAVQLQKTAARRRAASYRRSKGIKPRSSREEMRPNYCVYCNSRLCRVLVPCPRRAARTWTRVLLAPRKPTTALATALRLATSALDLALRLATSALELALRLSTSALELARRHGGVVHLWCLVRCMCLGVRVCSCVAPGRRFRCRPLFRDGSRCDVLRGHEASKRRLSAGEPSERLRVSSPGRVPMERHASRRAGSRCLVGDCVPAREVAPQHRTPIP